MNSKLSTEQRSEIHRTLKSRFEENLNRHEDIAWADVEAKLKANTEKLWSLDQMEKTGGEPDVVGLDKKNRRIHFL